MDLPDNVQTGIVTGRYIVDVIDGADANLEPDAVPVQGRIVFTASVPYLQNPAALPVPVTIMRAPIIGVLDADGYLCTPYPGTLEPLYRGVHLIATDDPDLVPQNWTWDVTYMFDPVGGKKLDIPPHGFALPTGSTVDLTNVAKVPSSPGYSLPQAEAAVLRAEQAAQQSAEDAADAVAAALRAEQVAGATDQGVASMLADPATETGQLMNDFLSSKANVTDVNAELRDKADRVATESALSLKVSKVEADQAYLRRILDQPLTIGTDNFVFIRDTSDAASSTFRYEDEAAHRGSIINLHHRGAGDGGYQAYGLNIANHPGAKAAFVIHQYSSNGAMIRLDNTDVYSAIQIWNTENQTMNPGNIGTGAFLDFKPWGETDRIRLMDSLSWLNATSKNVTFETGTASNWGLGVKVTKDIPALFIHKNSTGSGAGVAITNEGTSPGVDVNQNGNGLGIRVIMGAAATGYAVQVKGQTYGASFETELDASNAPALLVHKKGEGVGEGVRIINAGTGSTASYRNGALTEVSSINANGEYENRVNGNGVILRSPNGGRYRVTVGDTGTLSATKL